MGTQLGLDSGWISVRNLFICDSILNGIAYCFFFSDAEKKLKEKTEASKFLTRILAQKKKDPRTLRYFPKTTNQRYGWIASHKEFQLDKYGSDIFVPQPLPEIYKLIY